MNQRLQEAVACLNSRSGEAVQEAILLIGEAAFFSRSGIKSDVLPAANDERLEGRDMQVLRQTLIDFVEGDPFGPEAGSAIWALSKFRDRAMVETYRGWLRRYVEHPSRSAVAVGQLVASLSNLGEDVITDGSFSAVEVGKNFDDAVAYLRRQSAGDAEGPRK